MGKAKKWIAAITALSLAAFGGYRGLLYLKERNSPEVPVVDVASLITEDYFSYDSADTSLSGSIATNVVQNIRIDKDIIVGDLLVNVGDEVKKGDLLMTIDTTLTEMELGIAELEHQRIQQNLDKARDRLYSLQNGGPIEEDTGTGDEMDAGADSTDGYEIIEGDDLAFSGRAGGSDGSPYLAAAFPIVLAADLLTDGDSFDKSEGELLSGDLVDSGAEEMAPAENVDIGITDTIEPWVEEENYLADDISADAGEAPEGENLSEEILVDDSSLTEGELTSDGDLLSDDGLASDEMLISDDGELISEDPAAVTIITPTPVPTDTPVPTATPEPTPSADPYDYHFYDVLDSNSKAWVGDGTEEFPFVFLTTSETGYVVLKGSFLNRMMGYDPEGKEIVHEGGYWYCVEYYLDSVIEDPENREASRFGYYLMNGGEDRLVDVQGVVSDVGDENTYSGEDEYYDGEYYDGEGEYYDDTYFSEDEFAYRAADGETDDLDDGFVN